eukprot:9313118-Pyramimonas_sp.AAC.1
MPRNAYLGYGGFQPQGGWFARAFWITSSDNKRQRACAFSRWQGQRLQAQDEACKPRNTTFCVLCTADAGKCGSQLPA